MNEAYLRVVMKIEKYFHTKIGIYATFRTILCVHMCTGAYSVHAQCTHGNLQWITLANKRGIFESGHENKKISLYKKIMYAIFQTIPWLHL